jgi:hypothetical protein
LSSAKEDVIAVYGVNRGEVLVIALDEHLHADRPAHFDAAEPH